MCGIFAVHNYGTEAEMKAFRPRALVRAPLRSRGPPQLTLPCADRCSRSASVTAVRIGRAVTRRVTASSATSVSPLSASVSPSISHPPPGFFGSRAPKHGRVARRSLQDFEHGEATVTDELVASTDTGAQPLVNDDETLILAVNGEIYNHRTLRKNLKEPAVFKTHSDCEVIMHLVRLPALPLPRVRAKTG